MTHLKTTPRHSCTRTLACAAALAAFIAAAPPALAETAPTPDASAIEAPDPAAAAFERLKTLEGTWQIADQPEHGLRIAFSTTARGSVLVEEWTYKGAPHSLTLYHRDGDTLMATHYCPQGNQPRLTLAATEEAGGPVRFTFHDVTDYDPASEQHQHGLALAWDGDGPLTRSETYRDGEGGEHPSELVLARVEG